jgi:hypothetical protein
MKASCEQFESWRHPKLSSLQIVFKVETKRKTKNVGVDMIRLPPPPRQVGSLLLLVAWSHSILPALDELRINRNVKPIGCACAIHLFRLASFGYVLPRT